MQNELRSQLRTKGYRAKYNFEDVVGKSQAIEKIQNDLKEHGPDGISHTFNRRDRNWKGNFSLTQFIWPPAAEMALLWPSM